MDKLTILSNNVRGIREYDKRKSIVTKHVFPPNSPRPDIIFLQETHSQKSDEKKWKLDFRYDLYFHHATNTTGGLLIGFSRHLHYSITNIVREKDFMIICCQINNEPYVLVNVHFTEYCSSA